MGIGTFPISSKLLNILGRIHTRIEDIAVTQEMISMQSYHRTKKIKINKERKK